MLDAEVIAYITLTIISIGYIAKLFAAYIREWHPEPGIKPLPHYDSARAAGKVADHSRYGEGKSWGY